MATAPFQQEKTCVGRPARKRDWDGGWSGKRVRECSHVPVEAGMSKKRLPVRERAIQTS
jgi:hypothetical protein